MEIPQVLTIALPLIVAPLAGGLNSPRMPEWLRSFIAGLVIIIVAAFWALYVHALTPNFIEDFIIIAAYCSVLSTSLLLPLYKLVLVKVPSPFASFFKQPEPAPVAPVQIQTPPTVRGPLTPQ